MDYQEHQTFHIFKVSIILQYFDILTSPLSLTVYFRKPTQNKLVVDLFGSKGHNFYQTTEPNQILVVRTSFCLDF